ncbi:bifunctional UDP-sugar hydrolase/5'-nucleotidase [Sporosarcina sp. JAI121]|uniref:bifunctional metallophosphatase/5'-nucleotidase n=1 Tax=Sporosarcina sp. JAI121 TaxID=2723064 RepID=UPI0015CCF839|nr:bifunctional UDP-sugar hydrolase/5'-nucleotidase [Sporosarcina sp. JAI121]NYF26174.1 2',3'-cyclic-nucleotide 2'-phosphodiesterase (5'-nucleotidase family) [Sporosarcina sp. JAI121]
MDHKIETIHFYHTNDIHSHFESWPQISRLLCDKKRAHSIRGEACYTFDIGDHVDRSHPFTEGTKGLGNIMLLNEAGYDAVTIGNNEGITMSKEALSCLYNDARFDVILSNLLEEDGRRPEWALPYVIYITTSGTRIGVVGATAEYKTFYSKLGWEVLPPRENVKNIAESIAGETDLIVCLSHMGITEDEKLAVECPEIDVIFGAHTHHLFHEGKLIGETLLAATGKYGEYVGHVTVKFDTVTKRALQLDAELFRADSVKSDDEDIEKINNLILAGKQAMEEQVFYNPSPLSQNLFENSPLSSFFGRALISYTKADCAMFNAGIFLGSLDKGWVTKEDLHSLLPHPINPCLLTLDGEELMEVYELSLNEEWPGIEIKGLGFRGVLMGAMIHERLYRNRNGQLFAGNREVVTGQKYTLATLDMFTFGFFFPSLKYAEKEYYMPELIRDVLGWYGTEYNYE